MEAWETFAPIGPASFNLHKPYSFCCWSWGGSRLVAAPIFRFYKFLVSLRAVSKLHDRNPIQRSLCQRENVLIYVIGELLCILLWDGQPGRVTSEDAGEAQETKCIILPSPGDRKDDMLCTAMWRTPGWSEAEGRRGELEPQPLLGFPQERQGRAQETD